MVPIVSENKEPYPIEAFIPKEKVKPKKQKSKKAKLFPSSKVQKSDVEIIQLKVVNSPYSSEDDWDNVVEGKRVSKSTNDTLNEGIKIEVSKPQNDTLKNKVSKRNDKPLKIKVVKQVRDTQKAGIKTKSDRTLDRVSKCYNDWVSKHGVKPTQKEVSKSTNLSLPTIKRYWGRVVVK